MILRVCISGLFFLSIFLFPWYITTGLAFLVVGVSVGYEIIIGGLLLDMIYGATSTEFAISSFTYTLIFTGIFFVSFFVKKRLVVYHRS